MTQPAFWSLALVDIPEPDYADMLIAVLPTHATTDPAAWAHSLFALRSMPRWVIAAMALRQLLAPLIGVPRAGKGVFEVDRVEGDEALISANEVHLDLRIGVGVDETARLVRVVTVVRLKGWRGRLYFLPVHILHPLVVHAMMRRCQRLMAGMAV